MCYDIVTATKNKLKYAKLRGGDEEYIKELEEKIRILTQGEEQQFHVSGFSHPNLLVFTQASPFEPSLAQWGLIPSWIKTNLDAIKVSNQTLNARIETLFEKPAFKKSALHSRCLIIIDAFYEHHHIGKKSFPYLIQYKNREPMCVAGITSLWVNNETGEEITTASIITTKANPLMSGIHNNPKAEEPRMPAILRSEYMNEWLNSSMQKEDLEQLVQPIPDNELDAHTVAPIKGKYASENSQKALEPYLYNELNTLF